MKRLYITSFFLLLSVILYAQTPLSFTVDTQYGQVELDGELLNVTKGDFSNEAKKVIPLFYVSKID